MRRTYRSIAWGLVSLLGIVGTSLAQAGEVRVPIGSYATGCSIIVPVKSMKELREEGLTIQQLDYSCGSAALATIFNSYLGLPCTESDVIQSILKTGDQQAILQHKGFSLLDLKNYAESRGVKAAGYQLDYDALERLDCPVLVPIYIKEQNLRHFVVFLDSKDSFVYLADPARGRLRITRQEFEAQWTPKLGMVFSQLGTPQPPLATTVLAVRPQDDAHLSSAEVLSLAMPSSSLFVYLPTEF